MDGSQTNPPNGFSGKKYGIRFLFKAPLFIPTEPKTDSFKKKTKSLLPQLYRFITPPIKALLVTALTQIKPTQRSKVRVNTAALCLIKSPKLQSSLCHVVTVWGYQPCDPDSHRMQQNHYAWQKSHISDADICETTTSISQMINCCFVGLSCDLFCYCKHNKSFKHVIIPPERPKPSAFFD